MKLLIKLELFALLILTFAVIPAFAQANEAAKKRAEELLAQAREAAGGEAKINAVKSLSLTGKFQRGITANEVELDFLFPDKYIKREKINTPVGLATLVTALDGENAWFNFVSPNEAVKFQGFSQKDADEMKPASRADAAKWILALLLKTPSWSSMEFAYAGEGEADGKPANLIDVTGTDGFRARLFLDKTTNRLTMMNYTGKLPKHKNSTVTTDQEGNISQSESGGASGSVAGLKSDEVRVSFADYRAIDGIQIPHRVLFHSGEDIKEEWELTKVQLDATLAPENFKKKA